MRGGGLFGVVWVGSVNSHEHMKQNAAPAWKQKRKSEGEVREIQSRGRV